jgi:hypothetical protein
VDRVCGCVDQVHQEPGTAHGWTHQRAAGMALWLTDAHRRYLKRGWEGDEPAWDLTREWKAVRWLGDGERWQRLTWLGEGGAPSEEGRNEEWRRGR